MLGEEGTLILGRSSIGIDLELIETDYPKLKLATLPFVADLSPLHKFFLILIQWLLSLVKQNGEDIAVNATIAYDNMCNLDRLRAVATPLPLPPPLDKMWSSVTKIIDVFRFGNHVSPDCQRKYSPEDIKRLNPTWNTQAGEQTFTWLSCFKHIVCSMTKEHHLFYIHRMVVRRNAYMLSAIITTKNMYFPIIMIEH